MGPATSADPVHADSSAKKRSIDENVSTSAPHSSKKVKLSNLTELVEPNPFGIKPSGQLFFDSLRPGFSDARRTGLGALSALDDECLLANVLSLLDPEDWVRLSLASKALYVLTGTEEYWREKCLTNYCKTFNFDATWRRTYARANGWKGDRIRTKKEWEPTVRCDYYSDHLFHAWRCASVPLEAFLFNPKSRQVDTRSYDDGFSVEQFQSEFEARNRPVLITGAARSWPALSKWDRDYLLERIGERTLRAEGNDVTLQRYYQYADATRDESPLYVFDRKFAESSKDLAADYIVPEFFRDDLFSLLDDPRPDYRWIIIGPERSGSTFHIDPNATSAWNAVIRGSKKWIFFPPNSPPPGVFPSSDGSEVTSPVSLMEWFVNFYQESLSLASPPLECIAYPGDVVFVPSGWWHAVLNLETDTVAITQNFCSPRTLPRVLAFLRDRCGQVSGYAGLDDAGGAEVGVSHAEETAGVDLRMRLVEAVRGARPKVLKEAEGAIQAADEKGKFWQRSVGLEQSSCPAFAPAGGESASFTFGFSL